MKGLLLVLLLIGAGAALYVYYPRPQSVQAHAALRREEPAAPVGVEPVRIASVSDRIEAVGSLHADESAVISAELNGRIKAIGFKEGERVTKGQALISLDDAIFRAELAQARASLAQSRASYRRADELLRHNAGSAVARDQALARLRVNRARVVLARRRLAQTTIRAPFEGIVGLRGVSVGDYVQAGQDIVTLVDIDPIKVDFRVPEIYLSDLNEGQRVAVAVDAYPGEVFSGQVYAIDPVVDINGRAISMRARIPNAQARLRPGLFARVKLTVDTRPNAVLVDEAALVAERAGAFVYRIRDGQAILTKVKLGARRPGQVEILSGLKPRAVVVTAGQQRLSNGAAVEVVRSAAGS